MTTWIATSCGCTQEPAFGAKREKLCDHGNLFVKEGQGSKPRKALKRTQRRETAAEKKARLHFNKVVKSWPCWFRATRNCWRCKGSAELDQFGDDGSYVGKVTCPACDGDGRHHCSDRKDAHHLIPKDFIRQRYRGIANEEQLLAVLFSPLIGAPLCRKAHDAIEAGSDRIYWEDLSEECLEYVSCLPDFMLLRLERECPKRLAVAHV